MEVPKYEALALKEKSNRYCICVFVINEGERIRAQLQKMKAYTGKVDIILADGGSTDGSLAEDFLREIGVTALLTKRDAGKLSAQMRMAFHFALEKGYEGVIVMDGNNKDNPQAIDGFVEALSKGYDHVQGSRFVPGGRHENTPLSRLVGVKVLHAPLISIAAGFRYTDTTNGFRAYSARFLTDPRVQPFRNVFMAYELHYYLAIRAAKLGFKCLEIPVERVYPAKGKTPTKISPIKGNLLVLRTLFDACLGKFNP